MRIPSRSLTALALGSALVLTACGDDTAASQDTAQPESEDRQPLEVVVGFYPYQFVTERVGGDDVTVSNLTAPGAEPHDLELSPQQVAAIRGADLVVYSAGFQPAVDEAVEQQAADSSFDVLSVVEVRSYEDDDDHAGDDHADEGHADDDHADEENHADEGDHADEENHADEGEPAHGEDGHDDHTGEDPHVWLDPTRLSTIAEAVADELAELAPESADAFRERAQELTDDLEALDADLQDGLASCERTEMVTSHDAFGYLADRYGLEQVSISGLSPEDEPSPRRLAEVARFAEEREVTTIFFEELVSPRVAESLAREVGAEAKVLSPLEGPPEDGGYLEAMRTNLETLRTALDCT